MPTDDFGRATRSLFEEEHVEVVEWTFDIGWGSQIPDWLERILQDYAQNGNLVGHGVSYSPLDASSTERQEFWLSRLHQEVATRKYRHISEHFGFMGGGNFHVGAPLPCPLTEEAVAVGQARLKELAEVARIPVGLENLAFAFGPQDVRDQGRFLDELLGPTNGFLLLDLHNIYCHVCNFGISANELLDGYPLERVREIHVSGGSWSETESSDSPVRRDTHDDAVPDELFAIVDEAIPHCPNLEMVFLERLGDTLAVQDDEQFRADYFRLKEVVGAA